MEQNYQRTGLVGWLTLLGVSVLTAILARYANSSAGTATAIFLFVGFLVAIISYFQSRLAGREASEILEFEELKKSKQTGSLFAEADALPAARARQQFDRFFVPAFTLLLALLQSGAAVWLWRRSDQATHPLLAASTISMALFALFALVLFMTGKFAMGLVRIQHQALLRPGANYLLLGAVICSATAIGGAAVWFGLPRIDIMIARAIAVILGLTAAEMLIALVLEIYRPRVKGATVRLLYESRLVGLLGQPGGLVTTAAQALDYQFGFKVSETWFYKFLERALAWIVLLQLLVLVLSTSVVIITSEQQGLLERWGRPVTGRAILEPGLHLKWPWPIDAVRRFETRQVHSFYVGVVVGDEEHDQMTIVWTQPHYREEYNMLVASGTAVTQTESTETDKPVPANLVVASIPVQFVISDLEQWAYSHADAARLLQDIADREVTRYLVSVDFEELMSTGRLVAAQFLRENIQRRADALKLGVNIRFVGLQGIHPPIGDRQSPVVATFEEVVASIHRKETNILAAQAYSLSRVNRARAEATNLVVQAHGFQSLQIATAAAEASQFTNQVNAFKASPSVFTQYTYLDTLAQAIAPARKYVLAATNTSDVVVFNLEEEIREDLLNNLILPTDATRPPANN